MNSTRDRSDKRARGNNTERKLTRRRPLLMMYGFHFCLTFQVDLSFKQTKVVELDLYLYFDLRVLARILKKSAEIPA